MTNDEPQSVTGAAVRRRVEPASFCRDSRSGRFSSAGAVLVVLGAASACVVTADEAVAGPAMPSSAAHAGLGTSTPGQPTTPAWSKAAAEEGLSCGKISSCTDRCAAQCPSGIRKIGCLMSCKDDCRAKGCPSGQKRFDELTDCVASNCWASCMGGPTPDCRECTEEDCSAEAKKCLDHACGK